MISQLTLDVSIRVRTGTSSLRKQQGEEEKEETIYFAGIDISKFKHDCAVIDELGGLIQPSWSLGNDRGGFSLPKERMGSLSGEEKIGLEATGRYGQKLKLFLEANGFTFMEFSPVLAEGRAVR